MFLTTEKSARRSTSLSKISNLDPQGEKNFFEFYKKNSDPINQILTSHIRAHTVSPEDEGDLRQDVLLKLHRCNVLGQFDNGKSHFNTYLTLKVDCYVRLWLRQKRKVEHHKWSPWSSQSYVRPGENSLRFEQEYFSSLNGVNPNNNHISEDPLIDARFDEEYSSREMVDLLIKNLPKKLLPFLELLRQGYSKGELAEMNSVTSSFIYEQVKKIKVHGKRILKDLSF